MLLTGEITRHTQKQRKACLRAAALAIQAASSRTIGAKHVPEMHGRSLVRHPAAFLICRLVRPDNQVAPTAVESCSVAYVCPVACSRVISCIPIPLYAPSGTCHSILCSNHCTFISFEVPRSVLPNKTYYDNLFSLFHNSRSYRERMDSVLFHNQLLGFVVARNMSFRSLQYSCKGVKTHPDLYDSRPSSTLFLAV